MRVINAVGEMKVSCRYLDIKRGHAVMYFPECNRLMGRVEDDESGIPSYKRFEVEIHPGV